MVVVATMAAEIHAVNAIACAGKVIHHKPLAGTHVQQAGCGRLMGAPNVFHQHPFLGTFVFPVQQLLRAVTRPMGAHAVLVIALLVIGFQVGFGRLVLELVVAQRMALNGGRKALMHEWLRGWFGL